MRNQLIFSLILFISVSVWTESTTLIPVKVGVVVDMDTWAGKMGLRCISMALQDFYASHASYNTRLVLHTRDSNNTVVGAAVAALDLLKNVEVQAIIGPVTTMQANFVISLGDYAHVPIISFSATSPSLSSLRSEYFVRATLNDSSQVKAISSIIQGFGWREAVPIYADNEFGEGVIPFLTDALQEVDTHVPYRSVINPSASDDEIVAELYHLMTMQTRVFIVHMQPPLGCRLFNKAEEVGMMSEGYVWIITTGITNHLSLIDHWPFISMQGVLGVKTHVPRRKRLEDFIIRWKRNSKQDDIDVDLNIFGLWAYDAATALAIAVERVGSMNPKLKKANTSGDLMDLKTLPVSQIGKDLPQVLSGTRFRGLGGDFQIVNGQIQSSSFQIVNLIDNSERGIGFWTPELGITKTLNVSDTKMNSFSKANLKAIIWPGDSISAPKGWVIPTNGKKLRIGVPMWGGFNAFVNVVRDPNTTINKFTGYSIDVFDAVMETLQYHVPYEYIPFANSNGTSAGTYDDLVYEVFLGNYDAVVGDITIIANRSLYADFTLPYTASGITMVVPFRDRRRKNAWVFLKPLTWDLWVTSACFFVFIGIVVWILEHQTNEDFGGSRRQQCGTGFWFSFSTMVFSHKEKVVSNLARFVVIIWCFVVLILTQSYTASLTSMLTVQQLEPTVTDIHELIQRGENIGYPKGSFVLALLKKLNIPDSRLKVFDTLDELEVLFSRGSANGGIAAVFDEIPYLKLFLAKHCSKYTMVAPTLKADGFGFVFPIGSPLVSDVSRAILNVMEGSRIVEIEKTWFAPDFICPDPTTLLSSNSLRLGSFWGLFLIVGASSSMALIIFFSMLLFEHRNFLMNRYLKKSKQKENGIDTASDSSDSASTSTNCLPTQSSFPNDQNLDGQNDRDIVPVTEIVDPNQRDTKSS